MAEWEEPGIFDLVFLLDNGIERGDTTRNAGLVTGDGDEEAKEESDDEEEEVEDFLDAEGSGTVVKFTLVSVC